MEVGDGGISVAVLVNVGTAVSVSVGGMAVSVGGAGEGDKVNGISLATTVVAETVSFAGRRAV